jgi:hypothetical protein
MSEKKQGYQWIACKKSILLITKNARARLFIE